MTCDHEECKCNRPDWRHKHWTDAVSDITTAAMFIAFIYCVTQCVMGGL